VFRQRDVYFFLLSIDPMGKGERIFRKHRIQRQCTWRAHGEHIRERKAPTENSNMLVHTSLEVVHTFSVSPVSLPFFASSYFSARASASPFLSLWLSLAEDPTVILASEGQVVSARELPVALLLSSLRKLSLLLCVCVCVCVCACVCVCVSVRS
jgi:hypothetical protein